MEVLKPSSIRPSSRPHARSRTIAVAALCASFLCAGIAAAEEAPDKAIVAITDFITTQAIDSSAPGWKERLQKPPMVVFSKDKTYYWNMETSQGNIKIKLLPEAAPMHVSSTIYLTQLGFYDNTIFHRVIKQFMAQGGDPTGTGRGGPGYRYKGEFESGLKHDKKGLLSMANSGPGTDASQFFLTFVPTPHLNGKHTIFGEVVEGMATVSKIESHGSRSGKTDTRLTLKRATISVE
jgi:peptidyl-prolyl cis-trans isomerase B (cyclophilin B)